MFIFWVIKQLWFKYMCTMGKKGIYYMINDRFRSMTPMYYRTAKAALIVCDVSNSDSTRRLRYWDGGWDEIWDDDNWDGRWQHEIIDLSILENGRMIYDNMQNKVWRREREDQYLSSTISPSTMSSCLPSHDH